MLEVEMSTGRIQNNDRDKMIPTNLNEAKHRGNKSTGELEKKGLQTNRGISPGEHHSSAPLARESTAVR